MLTGVNGATCMLKSDDLSEPAKDGAGEAVSKSADSSDLDSSLILSSNSDPDSYDSETNAL